MNAANKLTLARVIMIPFFLFFLLNRKEIIPFYIAAIEEYSKWIALLIFALASITDALDGKIARKYNMITNFGKFMDPLADKLLVNLALIGLLILGKVNPWLVMLIIGRDFIISGFRLIAAEKGVVIAAGVWGKVKTAAQMIMIIFLIADIEQIKVVGFVLQWVVCILTVVSLIDYLVKNRSVLKEEK